MVFMVGSECRDQHVHIRNHRSVASSKDRLQEPLMPGRKPPRRGETGNGFMAPPRRGVERRRRTSPSSTTAASVVRSLAACARAWASNSSRMSTVAFTINHRTTHFAEAHAVAQGVFSIPTSATTKFVDEQGEGASPAGACVSRPAASAAAATPTAHAAGIAARVPTRIRLRARPPRGGSPGVCPRWKRQLPDDSGAAARARRRRTASCRSRRAAGRRRGRSRDAVRHRPRRRGRGGGASGGLAAGLRVGSAPGRAGPGEPDADRGPRTASAPAAGGRTPCPARGARSESRSSTTAAPPAAGTDAPQGAVLESAPGRPVAALTIPRHRGWAFGSPPVAGS